MRKHCSSKISQELISLGSGDILKLHWHLLWEVEKECWGEFLVVLVPIWEKALVTLFSFPGNHWLYPFISASINIWAWWRTASEQTVAWTGSSPTLLKFDLCIHPSAVVLSVINKAQSPHFRRPASKPIQGVIIAARYSSRLLVAWNWRWAGTWKCHACP